MKVKITADSTCDLPQAFLDRYGIRIFPLYIVRDGVALRDGIDKIGRASCRERV